MHSDAADVDAYLSELPADRRAALETVRRTILANLPPGYEETMNWGMITYQVPLEAYPDTYNRKPLMYAALASQKQYMTVYLTAIYMDEADRRGFERDYRATGKRYDVGKSCVRFRRLEDLPLEVIGAAIASTPMGEFVARTRAVRSPSRDRT